MVTKSVILLSFMIIILVAAGCHRTAPTIAPDQTTFAELQ